MVQYPPYKRAMSYKRTQQGFTLIELLVVIAIIGILAATVLGNLNSARDKSYIARVQSDLKVLQTAAARLALDTGKWPNGCPENVDASAEVLLDGATAGLMTAPPVGVVGAPCEWTAVDVSYWDGPYISKVDDPWGNSYVFDPDYYPLQNCGAGSPPDLKVVLSFGPNGAGINAYDCDDIYTILEHN